jgi:hypothetical protein
MTVQVMSCEKDLEIQLMERLTKVKERQPFVAIRLAPLQHNSSQDWLPFESNCSRSVDFVIHINMSKHLRYVENDEQ